jgi:uncharacterized protein (UPF0147 family)
MTHKQQQRALEIMKSLPKNYQLIGKTAERCVAHLMKTQGKTLVEAEDMVIKILEECANDIKSGQTHLVIASLEMIFLDMPLEEAAEKLLKSL